jgi:hypothetical protein
MDFKQVGGVGRVQCRCSGVCSSRRTVACHPGTRGSCRASLRNGRRRPCLAASRAGVAARQMARATMTSLWLSSASSSEWLRAFPFTLLSGIACTDGSTCPAPEMTYEEVNAWGPVAATGGRLCLTHAPVGGGIFVAAVKWNQLVRDARFVEHAFGNVERPPDQMSWHRLSPTSAAGSFSGTRRSRSGTRRSRFGTRRSRFGTRCSGLGYRFRRRRRR